MFFQSEYIAQMIATAINAQVEVSYFLLLMRLRIYIFPHYSMQQAMRTAYRPALDYGKSAFDANQTLRLLWNPAYDVREDEKFFNEVVGGEPVWCVLDNYYHDLCRQYQRFILFPTGN